MLTNKTRLTNLTVYLAIAVLTLLSGCAALEAGNQLLAGASDYFMGGEDNQDPPSALMEYPPEVQVEELWQEKVGVGADEHYLKLVSAVAYGRVYAADRKGLLVARDAVTGDRVWEVESQYSFSAGPGVGRRVVVMGTSAAEVIAFNIENGEKRWVTPVSSEVLSVPVLAEGMVVVRTTDGKVMGLREETGAVVWTFERNVPALSIRGTGTPIVVDNNVVSGYASGKLEALRINDGKSVWEATVAVPTGRSEVERLVDLDADPVASRGVVFVASYQGGSAAVSQIDGDVIWRNESVSSYSGMTADWRYLYVSDTQSHVWQLDQRSGGSLWKQQELQNRKLTAPAAYENYVVVADFEGYVHWLSSSDGRQLGRIRVTDAAIEARPVVVDGTVYVYAKNGRLAALKAR